jgi:hypothetical protein
VFKGGIKIHSFQEAQGIAGMKGLDEKVWFPAAQRMSHFSLKND